MSNLKKTLAIMMATLTCVSTMNVAVFADTDEVVPADPAATVESVDEETPEEAAEEAEEATEEAAPEEDIDVEAQEEEEAPEVSADSIPEDAMEVDGFYICFSDNLKSDLQLVYTGSKQKPSITIWDKDGNPLNPSTDFKRTYTDNLSAGTAYVYIKGLTSKTMTAAGKQLNAQIKFTITPAPIPKTIKLDKTSYPYAAGNAICPAPTIVGLTGKNLAKGTSFTVKYSKNKAIGTAKLTVTGKGNYKGTATKTFKITKCPASKLTYKLSKTKYTYNGKACKPKVTVYNGKTKLSSKKYKLTYSANVKPGTAKVKVTMKDTKHYTGYKTVKFTIYPSKPVISSAVRTDSGAKITWKKVTGVDGYYLYRKAGNGSYKLIKQTTATSYADTSVKLGGSYTYYVVAYKDTLKSAKSAAKTLTIVLPTPEITKAEPAKTGGIRLQTKLSGGQLYEVYRCPVDGNWSLLVSKTSAKELADWVDTTAKKGKTYDYQVITWGNFNSKTKKYGAKAYSNIVRATCTKTDPEEINRDKVSGGLIIVLPPETYDVAWDAIDGITPTFEVKDKSGEIEKGTAGYELQWSVNEDFENSKFVKITDADPETGAVVSKYSIKASDIPKDAEMIYVRVRSFQSIDGTTSKSDWGSITEIEIIPPQS